jgi:tetratricopeptide (TPR) repeat protein
MKYIFSITILLCAVSTSFGQQLTSAEWDEQAKTNMRLIPKYGHQQKTEEQKQLDEKLIKETLALEKFNGDRTATSNHMISLGFKYLNRGDLKTAMYRFNQAYLFDSLNTDIYWGYGAVYLTLGNYSMAKKQYDEGLALNPDNTHLLTDIGTYYAAQYFPMQMMPKNDFVKNPEKLAQNYLDSALIYLKRSYELDPKDQNTTFKLSTACYYKGDCENAWKYYDECSVLGGQPITEDYTRDLKKKCKRKK